MAKVPALFRAERCVANFPFASAGFVFLLLEGSVPKPIQACWPKDPEVNPSYTERVPDAMLLRGIASGREPAGWHIMLTSSLNKHSSQLVIETYWTYMAIVVTAKKKKWDEALEHARVCRRDVSQTRETSCPV